MPDQVLIVNMNYLGDALMTTPALRDLRCALPDARIDTIVGAGAAAALIGNPDVDRVIARRADGGLSRIAELYRLLRKGRYDTVVVLPPLSAYGLAAWLARTPRRIGQMGRGMDGYLTERRDVHAVHMADRMRETMPVLQTIDSSDRRLHVHMTPQEVADARTLLSDARVDDGFVAINLGATRPQKRWTAAGFAGLLDGLRSTQCVLVGAGAQDKQLAADVLRRTGNRNAVNLVGHTTVKTLAAMLKQAAVLVSADSGPLHLATAVETPVVALFGSTDAHLTGPYDTRSLVLDHHLSCAPCIKNPTCSGRFDCMAEITPDEVIFAVRKFLRAPERTLEVMT